MRINLPFSNYNIPYIYIYMGDPQRYEYEELDDLLAAEDAADNALITVAEEEALLGELKDLDDERVKEITEAETDAELAKLEATLAEGEKEEEEEEDLDAQLAELNNEQEITDAEADAQLAALEAEVEETADPDLADAFVVPAAPAAVAPAAEEKGWFHRTTGFSSNRIPGWQRMRAMTGWGRKTRKRRKARKPRRTRRKRRARKTRRKRKTRKSRRKRKTRRKRRRRR